MLNNAERHQGSSSSSSITRWKTGAVGSFTKTETMGANKKWSSPSSNSSNTTTISSSTGTSANRNRSNAYTTLQVTSSNSSNAMLMENNRRSTDKYDEDSRAGAGDDEYRKLLGHGGKEEEDNEEENSTMMSTYHSRLPKWIAQYFKWHHDMRLKYPGNKIFTDPQAPNILIRICHTHQCGGLHDRLGQLPLDLFLAARSNRILMIQWFKPFSLDKFLVPPTLPSSVPGLQINNNGRINTTTSVVEYSIDWRMPKEWTQCRHLRECIRRFSNIPSLETNVGNGHVRGKNYSQMMDANYYNLTRGGLKDEKIVQFEIMGHGNEDWLENHLRREGETDMIHHTPTFGNIFHSFFQLSPPIQTMYNHITQSLNLTAQEYIAVHLRVRHPSGYRRNAKMDGRYAGNADRNVPPFANEFRESAIKVAVRALECTRLLKYSNGSGSGADTTTAIPLWSTSGTSSSESSKFLLPVYMMSDTKDLVNYFVFELSSNKKKLHDDNYNRTFSKENNPESSIDSIAKRVASKFYIISRQLDDENLHIDKATPPGKLEQYYSVFLDLFLGINAKCIVFGIGNFAVFAAKISNTPCKIRYQRAKLGTQGIEAAVAEGGGSLSRDQICGKLKTSW
jgi:hypothetical protein